MVSASQPFVQPTVMSVPANRMKIMDKFIRNSVDDKVRLDDKDGVDCVDGGG